MKILSASINRDVVDGIDMGITTTKMWFPNIPHIGDVGRYRVEWSYPLPRPSKRHKQRISRGDHDCDSLAEAEAYLAARTKYYADKPNLSIRIIDRARQG